MINEETKPFVRTMITTTDNPFDPFEDFDKWYAWDESNGYHTCAYLDRILKTSSEFSDNDQNEDITKAIDEIVKLNLTGTYKKVTRVIEEPVGH